MSVMVSFFYSEANSQENLETPRQRDPQQRGEAATGQRVTTNDVRYDHRALDKSLEDELKILTNPRRHLDLLALSR